MNSVFCSSERARLAGSSWHIAREEEFMNPPKVILNADPPKAWFNVVNRGLDRHNTATTAIVEYYPVGFVIREPGNHVRGGLVGNLWAAGCTLARCGSIERSAGAGSEAS